MEYFSGNCASEKRGKRFLLPMMLLLAVTVPFVCGTSALATQLTHELVASGSGSARSGLQTCFGIVGQSSPVGKGLDSAGHGLYSANLLMISGLGASSPTDIDGDGTPDSEDAFPNDPGESIDRDGDGAGDHADLDDDDDGTPDSEDLFPNDPGEQYDSDGDGIGNNAETDDDADGVNDDEENGADNSGDGNGDSIADSLQNNVVSLKAYGSETYVTMESPAGTTLSHCQSTDNPSVHDSPRGMMFKLGFFDFTIGGLDPGAAAWLKLYLPEGHVPDTYFKYGRTPDNDTDHWYEFLYDGVETGAEIDGHVVTLHFVDGKTGDDILTEDSQVIDLGAPGFAHDSSSCFIDTLF